MVLNNEQWLDLLWAALISSSFFGETKIGIPYALYYNVPVWITYVVCCIANCFAFPFTMFFLDFFHKKFFRFPFYRRWIDSLLQKTRKKTFKLVKKYGYLGILIFVMFPVPMTGAYIGSVACWLFEMDRKRSFIAVSIGAFIAGAIIVALWEAGMIAKDSFE